MRPETTLSNPNSTDRPLLTIAIPTFNRAQDLLAALTVLEPQLAAYPQVEVLVSDNASADDTPQVLAVAQERFAAQGIRLEIQRHAENIGSDANFVSCYHRARGSFFWLCGDDDLIVPGGLTQLMPHLQDAAGN